MPPTVSILIPTDLAHVDRLSRTIAMLQAQDLTDWQCLFIGPGPTLAAIDPRISHISARGPRAALLNQAIDAASGRFLLFLDPLDSLEPSALSTLLNAADHPDLAGAVGAYRFHSNIGQLPGDPLAGAPDRIGWDELIRTNLFPMHAMLLSRRALGDLRFRTNIESAWDLDLWLRIAETGLIWARTPDRTGTCTLRPLADDLSTLRALASHIRTVSDSLARRGQSFRTAEFTCDYTDALLLLRAHRYAIDQHGPRHLSAATRFPALFAQWWQRLGFYGNPPRHVLAANGGAPEAIVPDLIARRLVDACPGTPILLGLGKNARRIARHLHERNLPVRGRDDSLTEPPAWSIEDGIPVELIPRDSLYDPAHPYIMTVLHDAAYLARLPRGLTITRWADMPDLILSDWRDSILSQASHHARTPEPVHA